MIRMIAAIFFMTLMLAGAAQAQSVAFSYDTEPSEAETWPRGMMFDVDYPVWGALNLAGGVSRMGMDESWRTFVGVGPRLRFGNGYTDVFVHMLIGKLQVDGMDADMGGYHERVGGGFDVRLAEHWFARASADYDGIMHGMFGFGYRW